MTAFVLPHKLLPTKDLDGSLLAVTEMNPTKNQVLSTPGADIFVLGGFTTGGGNKNYTNRVKAFEV